jgi:hypothetical protein
MMKNNSISQEKLQMKELKKEYEALLEKVHNENDDEQKESLFKSIKLLHFNMVLLEEQSINKKFIT